MCPTRIKGESMKRLFTIMMLFCAAWLTNAQTPPTIIYVTQQGAGNKNGFSWDNAMSNVQDAIDQAVLWGIKQVWVAEGTYVNTHNSWGEVYVRPIILHDGVSLYGGFAGNEPADYDLSLRNLTTNTSILDGNHSTRVLTQYNDFVNPITVDGFTIQNGHANWVGGAVLKGNATISNCIIRNNSAELDLYDDDLISNRKACGGLYCSSASVISCKIIQNEISYLGSSWGGSISAQVRRSYAGGIVTVNSTISNCLIYNNNTNQETAYQCTGGVVADGSTLINCDIVRNNTNAEQGAGGLYCNGAGNTFVNCVIWGNNGSDGHQNVFSSNLNYNTQPVFSHCAVEAPSGSNLYNYLTSGETNIILDSENNVFSDGGAWCPNFTNPNNGDFTLKPTSILINGGTTDGITPPEFDLNRNARIQQNSIDIGCYEFTKNGTYGYTGIVYVKPTGAGDSTGTSWANAMPDLQTAVNTAHALGDGCQVWVATGTYYGNRTNSDSRAAFTMKEGVNVYGGFAGDEPSNYNLSQRNYSINTTILDGQQIRRVLDQLKVFETQTTWDGFTIRNGAFLGCQLMGNAVLSHCEICNNRISDSLYFFIGDGGGVWARNSTLSFCNIHNNSNQTGGDGGGIFVDTCTIINCRINNNISNGNGGGVRSIASEFINCEISNNTTNGEYYTTGGGAYANSSSFVNCNIVNNKTEHGVGGVACVEEFHWDYDYEEEEYYSYELVSFTNCVIWGNRQGDKQSNILAPNDYQTLNVHVVMNNCAVESGYDGEKNIALASTNEGAGTFFPRFVLPTAGAGANYSGGDWRLQNNSVLINRGDTTVTGLPITDLAGNSRIQQGQIDIGCYESASQGVVLPGTPGPIIYVTQNGAGSRNGTSWDNAMSNLDWAVSLASMYDSVQVWVATGIYYGNTSAENAFTMRENVNVYGGFAGNEPANFDLSQRELSINPTVLDGQNSRIVLCQLRHFRHITEWDGFILRNGYSPVGSSLNAGGAYLKANGKLSHCSIHNNNGYAVVGYGRKNNIGYGHGFVSNCLLRNNSLGANGGTYTNCSIVANGGEGVSAGNFKNCVLWGNEAKLSNTYYANFSHCAVEGGFGSGYITLESANDGAEGFYPRFVSPTAGAGLNYNGGDWRLQNGSVCINNGDTAGLDSSSMDLAGNSRVLHGQVDIGCYESFSDDMVVIPQYPDNIVYVTQTGSGTNDGSSWDNAMADIQQAMTYAAIYDSVNVWVAAGTYYGDTTAFSTEEASANAFHMRDGVQVYGGLAGNEPSNYDLSQRDFATNTTILDGQYSRRVLLQDYDFRFKSEWNGFTLQNGHTPWNGAGCYLRVKGVLNHCVISNNTISFHGGGGVFLDGSASLLNCIVRNNSAMMPNYTPEHDFGSEAYTYHNTAGGVYHVPGDQKATIRNCIISNNNGSYCGGVLLRDVDMTGCLICNNSGEIGGGLIRNVNNWDMLSNTVINCDIVNNKSTNSFVGGVFYSGFENYYYDYYFVYDDTPDTLTFANCIIWGNKSDGLISNIGNSGTTFASFKYCAVEQDGLGSTNLPLLSENEGDGHYHPRFVAPTVGAGAEYSGGDWQLQEGSACINRGGNIDIAELDLAGNPRIQLGRIDIGCYEYTSSDSSIITCDTTYNELYGSFCKSFTWNETTYTTSGDYVQHFFNANGCDSIVTLHLTIQSADTVITSDTICGGVRTMLINASEEYLQENYYLYNHSSDTCQITYLYNNMFDESDGITIIDVDGEFWNGTYYDMVSTSTSLHELDCDSTYIHHNIIKFTDAIVTWDTGCGKYIWNGDTLTQSGTYEHYFTNTFGCDSVETLILCMRPSVYEDITDTANESYTFNGFTYHESGVYTQILDIDVVIEPDELYFDEYYGAWWWYDEEWGEGWSESEMVTLSGCKIVTLNLTINCINYSDLYEEFCDSYVWNDSVYTTSGEYTQTFIAANGCDSVVTLHLTVNNPVHTETTAESCGSYSWNGQTYTASGEYMQSFTAANGCDSVVTLNLTINQPSTGVDVQTACGSFTWINGITYTESNSTATYTLTNAAGCDSVVTLNLTINQLTTGTDEQTACGSFTWIDSVTYTESNNTATFTLTNAAGCDSMVTLNLTIFSDETSDLSVTTPDSCYTWNSETYCTSGDYTQTLQTVHGCDSVVTLHLTITVGIDDYNLATSMTVYPNPTTGVVNVQCTMNNVQVETMEILVYDAFGRLLCTTDGVETQNFASLQTDTHGSSVQTQIDLSRYASGVYLIKAVADGNVVAVRKIVKH